VSDQAGRDVERLTDATANLLGKPSADGWAEVFRLAEEMAGSDVAAEVIIRLSLLAAATVDAVARASRLEAGAANRIRKAIEAMPPPAAESS
jgi:hypothetical protein